MPYTSVASMTVQFSEAEIIAVSDRGKVGGIDDAAVEQAIAEGDAEIDSYLSIRYVTPVEAPIPARLANIAGDIARYHLHDRKPPELVVERYNRALATLRDMAQGKQNLEGALQLSGDEATHDVPSFVSVTNDWSRTNRGWNY